MKKIAVIISFLVLLLSTACNENYKFTLEITKKTTLHSSDTITLKEKNNKPIDRVQFFVNGKEIAADKNAAIINRYHT